MNPLLKSNLQNIEINSTSNSNFSSSHPFPLHDAVKKGDLNVCISLIKQGYLPDAKNQIGLTPIHIAITNHHKEICEYFITQIDINKIERIEWKGGSFTIREFAILEGNLEIVKLFVEEKKEYSEHLLTCAVINKSYLALKWLLTHIEFSIVDCGCLELACQNDDFESAYLIINNLSLMNILKLTTSYNYNALMSVCAKGSYELAKLIAEKAVREDQKIKNCGVISDRIHVSTSNALRWLIENSYYFNDYDEEAVLRKSTKYYGILSLAMISQNEQLVDFILEITGPAVIITAARTKGSCKYTTALELATQLNLKNMLPKLLSKLQSIFKNDLNFEAQAMAILQLQNTLSLSIQLNRVSFVKMIVEWDVKGNHNILQDDHFVLAIVKNNDKIIHYLMSLGANPCGLSRQLTYEIINTKDVNKIKRILKFIFSFQGIQDADIEMIANKLIELIRIEKNYCVPFFLFGLKINKSGLDWENYLSQYNEFLTVLSETCINGLVYENKKTKDMQEWILIELFYHILNGTNTQLGFQSDFFLQLADLFKEVTSKNIKHVMLALQVCPSIENIIDVLPLCHQDVPSKEQFKTFDLKKQCQWLTFSTIFRSRLGLPLAFHSLKHTSDTNAQILALKVIEQTKYRLLNKNAISKFKACIYDLLIKNTDPIFRIQAFRTFFSIDDNSSSKKIEALFILELKKIDNDVHLCSLIDIAPKKLQSEQSAYLSSLIQFSESQNEKVAFHATMALAKMTDINALLAALKVIKKSPWNMYNENYGLHNEKLLGNALTLRFRPDERHDNRLAMIERIQDQIVHSLWHNPELQMSIQISFEQFKLFKTDHFLKDVENKLKQSIKSIRFPDVPFFFPSEASLLRGIGTRKNLTNFQVALFDLLMKGCGSSDLSDGDPEIDLGTWNKIGHIFSSHDINLFFSNNNSYFSEDDGALIVFAADYFNEAYIDGKARIDNEGTLNQVFYEGIPKKEIQAIYIHEKYKNDLILLAGDKPLNNVIPNLTSDVFKNRTYKELLHLRRQLQIEDIICIGKEIGPKSLFSRLHFYNQKNEKMFNELKSQFHFCTRQEIYDETIKRMIGRQIIQRSNTPAFFMGQDKILSDLTDTEFTEQATQFFEMMPQEILNMAKTKNNHGHKQNLERRRIPISVLEHTQEVLYGKHGGFGLKTDIENNCPEHKLKITRKLLRIAAIFHDIGKIKGLKDHIKQSILMTQTVLTKLYRFFGIQRKDIYIISILIKYNDIFSRYTHPRSNYSLEDFRNKLLKLHGKISKFTSIFDYNHFCRMLFVLYLADASTLKAVQEKKHLYLPLLKNIATLDFNELNWLNNLRHSPKI